MSREGNLLEEELTKLATTAGGWWSSGSGFTQTRPLETKPNVPRSSCTCRDCCLSLQITAMTAARPCTARLGTGLGIVLDNDSVITSTTSSWGALPAAAPGPQRAPCQEELVAYRRTSWRPSCFRYTAPCRRTKGVQLIAWQDIWNDKCPWLWTYAKRKMDYEVVNSPGDYGNCQ